MSNSIKQYKKSSAVITLSSLVALFSIITAIVNYAKPECTKSLVNLFGGEKDFALAVTLIASISLALIALSIAYIADKSVKVKEVKDLNFILKKALSEKIDSDAQKRVITINKDDLSITDDLHELVFYYNDEALVITKDCSFLTIAQEEENDKISSYQEWFDEEEKSIDNTEAIKNKLFCGDDKTLKNITILPITYQDRNREDGVFHFLDNVTSSYNCIQKYIS